MAIQLLNLGIKNDPSTGDSLYDGGNKINENFTELYNTIPDLSNYVDKTTVQSIDGLKTFLADISLSKNINLVISSSGAIGNIFQDNQRFIHTYTPSITGAQEYMRNLFIGREAGNFNLSDIAGASPEAAANIGIGAYALNALTTGTENIAFGTESLALTTTGHWNTAFGSATLYSNVTGDNNVAFGRQAGVWISSGSGNIFMGKSAGFVKVGGGNLTTINESVLIGQTAQGTQGGTNEIAIGSTVQGKGSNTVTLGNDSITDTFLKGMVTLNGRLELPNATVTDAIISVGGVGFMHNSGQTQSFYQNTFLGYGAGSFTGAVDNPQNVGIGAYALNGLTTGIQNVALGWGALTYNATGSQNMSIGDGSLYALISGNNNVAIGKNSLQSINGASGNIAIGRNSGIYAGAGTGTALSTGSNHILIGYGARPSANLTTNEIAIGYNALGNGSNTATIGNSSNTAVYLKGKANISNVPTYADDAAAGVGGLIAGDIYATVTGEVRVKL